MTKTIFITGGSRGIGEAIVREAAGKMNVAFTYFNSEERALLLQYVRDKLSVAQAVNAVKERFGRIDILVNNAGVACDGLLIDLSDEQWKDCFDVNVNGTYNVTKAVLPDMLSDMRGSIVNMSSVWGVVGASNEVAYSAAKAAVIGFTKALAKEVAPMGVRVNAIAPGAIDTDMMRAYNKDEIETLCRENIPLGRLGGADEIAKAVLFAAESSYMSGAVLSVDGLLS